MFGTTNAIETKKKKHIDDNTLFLMTDTLEDQSKYHHDLTVVKAVVSNSQTRDNRNSIYFNTTDQAYINIGGNFNELIDWGQSWTVEYWRYPLSNNGGIFHSKTVVNKQYGIYIGASDQATNRSLYLGNAANSNWTISNKAMANANIANQWVHYAVVRNGGNVLTFCNGALINTTAYTIANTAPIITTIGAYWGVNNSNTGIPEQFSNGYLQDFRISNVARYTVTFTPPTRFI